MNIFCNIVNIWSPLCAPFFKYILPTQTFDWYFFMFLDFVVVVQSAFCYVCLSQVCNPAGSDTIHNYCVKTLNGTQYIPFSRYAGRHVLIVNVATYWGLTFQYVGKCANYFTYSFPPLLKHISRNYASYSQNSKHESITSNSIPQTSYIQVKMKLSIQNNSILLKKQTLLSDMTH